MSEHKKCSECGHKKCKCKKIEVKVDFPPGPKGDPGPPGPKGDKGDPGPPGPKQDTVCDCCVTPMKNVLSKIPIGTVITLGTIDDTSGNLQNVTLKSVSDFIVTVTQGNNTIAVPICKVTGVAGKGDAANIIRNILLQLPVNNTGECACCEDPVRRFLQGITKADIDVLGPAFNNIQNATILQVGEGIVKIQAQGLEVAALSICHITQIINFVMKM